MTLPSFLRQIPDPTAYLKNAKEQLSPDNLKLRSFVTDVDNWVHHISGSKRPDDARLLIHKMASHFRFQPRLLYGLNSLIRPQYRLECLTTITRVNYYVLVEGRKCWIHSFLGYENLPSSDEDVRILIHSKETWLQVLSENTDDEWRACLAQVLQEISDDPTTDAPSRVLAQKCLIRLGRVAVVPPSIFVHFVTPNGIRPSDYASKAEYISSGGGCDVHRVNAENTSTCFRVVRQTEASDVKKLYRAFCVEVITWRQLKHPNVLGVLGATLEVFPKRVSFILPWLHHGSIMSHLKQNPGHDKYASICQIVDAVEYLHGLDPPVSHKDIKGANVLVRDDLVCVLTDFGLSRILDSHRSRSSECMGTFYWMPPELFETKNVNRDPQAGDIYSLGCTIYEIYTGTAPSALTLAVIRGERLLLPPPGVWTEEELDIWSCVGSCVQARPADRPTIKVVKQALQDIRSWVPCKLQPAEAPNADSDLEPIDIAKVRKWVKQELYSATPAMSALRLDTVLRLTVRTRGLHTPNTPSYSSLPDFESSDEASSPSSPTSARVRSCSRLRPLPPTPRPPDFHSAPTPPITPRPTSSMSQNRTEVPRRTRGGRPMVSDSLSAVPLHLRMGVRQGPSSIRPGRSPLRLY